MSAKWDEINHLTRSIFRRKIERADMPVPQCTKFVVYRLGEDMCAICKRKRIDHKR